MPVRFVGGRRRLRIFVIHPSAMLTDTAPHGDGLLAYRYITELAARGHEVHVAYEQTEIRDPVPAGVTLHRIACDALGGGLQRMRYAFGVRRLFARLHRDRPFDIAHQLNPVFTGLSLALVGASVPVVLGPYVPHWPSDRRARTMRVVMNLVTRLQQRAARSVILASESARSRVADPLRRTAKTTVVIPYGIDVAAFASTRPDADDATILCVGSLTERKGILVLLRAFEDVARRVPKARLRIVGEGVLRPRVAELVAGSRFSDRIEILGPISHREIARQYARATVFCLPSFGEPYGMSLVEAMACGLPVVASNDGGPPALVSPNGAHLVAPGNAEALAAALIDVLEHPEVARRMGAANRIAAAAHDWPLVMRAIESVYAGAMAVRQ